MAKAANPKAVRGGPGEARRDEIVETAVKAWNAIMSGEGDRWPYSEAVCPALRLCREDAMQRCGLDPKNDKTPTKNGLYNVAMTRTPSRTWGCTASRNQHAKRASSAATTSKRLPRGGRSCGPRRMRRNGRRSQICETIRRSIWRDFAKMQGWSEQVPQAKTFSGS